LTRNRRPCCLLGAARTKILAAAGGRPPPPSYPRHRSSAPPEVRAGARKAVAGLASSCSGWEARRHAGRILLVLADARRGAGVQASVSRAAAELDSIRASSSGESWRRRADGSAAAAGGLGCGIGGVPSRPVPGPRGMGRTAVGLGFALSSFPGWPWWRRRRAAEFRPPGSGGLQRVEDGGKARIRPVLLPRLAMVAAADEPSLPDARLHLGHLKTGGDPLHGGGQRSRALP